MNKLCALSLSLVAALALAAAPLAFAGQKPTTTKPVTKKTVTKTMKPGTTRVSGFVKGAPTGKTFVVAGRGGTTTVDASKATIRANGKFASFDAVKPGTQATVTGTMQGTTLMATSVELHPRAGKTVTKTPVKTNKK